ncbi:MAG: DUF47 family protein [Candidatus Riflebacteria bacterium]|nr:DUF47 family protein [Candidatus Riflebacteria bacterium]
MLNWFLPRETRFFAMLTEQVENVLVAAKALLDLLHKYENLEEKVENIHQIEHRGDNLCLALNRSLAATFITPIDREDIHALARSIERMNDYIDAAAKRMQLFRIKKPTAAMIKQGELIQRCAAELVKMIPKLSNPTFSEDIRVHIREIDSLEKEGDRVHHTALAELFQEEKDAIKIIKFKEVLEYLEEAIDSCHGVCHVIETIVVKNA